MTRITDYRDDSLAVGRGMLRLTEHGNDETGRYFTGDYMDPRAFVSVYMGDDYTRLDVVSAGRLFMRAWDRSFSRRTLPQLARQFLSDVAEAA